EWGYKRNLEFDPLATQRGTGCQGCDLVKSTSELRYRFNQCRSLQRLLPRLAPPLNCRFGHAGLGEVMRQQFRFGRSSAGKFIAKGFAGATVQSWARALEKILKSRVLNERVLETIVSIRRWALPQEDVGISEPV